MAKRNAYFGGNPAKKAKTDDLEQLWGDDFDPEEVEINIMESQRLTHTQIEPTPNCSMFPDYKMFDRIGRECTSTQLSTTGAAAFRQQRNINLYNTPASQQTANCSILTNYETFKGIDKRFASTQLSSSNDLVQNCKLTYEEAVQMQQTLKSEIEGKNGEVTILRNQLKEQTKELHSIKTKIQVEWADKLSEVNKQLRATKSLLDFKDLEIANLKQQFGEMSKRASNNFMDSIMMCNENDESLAIRQLDFFINMPDPFRGVAVENVSIIETNVLAEKITMEIFDECSKECTIIILQHENDSSNAVPILKNRFAENLIKKTVKLQPKYTLIDKNKLGMDAAVLELKLLRCSTKEQLDSDANKDGVTKLLYISYELLHNLFKTLSSMRKTMSIKDIRDISNVHHEKYRNVVKFTKTVFSPEPWFEQECGVEVRRSVAVLSEIFPYSVYLKNIILFNGPLKINPNETALFDQLETCYVLKRKNKHNYLFQLMKVLRLIRNTNTGYYFPGLQCAILNLLDYIALDNNTTHTTLILEIMYQMAKNILVSRPHELVLRRIVQFLKVMCTKIVFVNLLCKRNTNNSFKTDKDGTTYFNDDTCFIQVLWTLIDSVISKARSIEALNQSFALEILQVCYHIAKSNTNWKYFKENKQCDCLYRVCKLSIDTGYKVMRYVVDNDTFSPEQLQIFHCCIMLLNIFCARSDFLVVRYMDTHVQFQYLVNSLLEISDNIKLTDTLEKSLFYVATFLDEKPAIIDSDEVEDSDCFDKILTSLGNL